MMLFYRKFLSDHLFTCSGIYAFVLGSLLLFLSFTKPLVIHYGHYGDRSSACTSFTEMSRAALARRDLA